MKVVSSSVPMRLTSKGQVTIPIDIRHELGVEPGDLVEFVVYKNAVHVQKSTVEPSRGQEIVNRLKGSATANVELSTDELMALMRGD